MSNTKSSNRFGARSWWWLAAILPGILVLLVVCFVAINEVRSSMRMANQVSEWKQRAEPFDDASLKESYELRTYSEGTDVWLDIIELAQLDFDDVQDHLPIVESKELPLELNPNAPWPEEEIVCSFLDHMKPWMDRVVDASKYPTPVRFPIEFHGYETLLPWIHKSRSAHRIVSLDFEYAIHTRDSKRALRDLELMFLVEKAFDSPVFLVSEYLHMAISGSRYYAILRSLVHSQSWQESELAVIQKQLSNVRYSPSRWKQMFQGERAMVLSSLNSKYVESNKELTKLYPLFPSGREQLAKLYVRLAELGVGDISSLLSKSQGLENDLRFLSSKNPLDSSHLWIAHFLPAIVACATAEVRSEEYRRLTLTATALRRFHLAHGTWPTRLSELEEFDLRHEDYSTVERATFGFEVEDGIAYLWSIDRVHGDGTVELKRPDPDTRTVPPTPPSHLATLRPVDKTQDIEKP